VSRTEEQRQRRALKTAFDKAKRRALNVHLFCAHGLKELKELGSTEDRLVAHGNLHERECAHTHTDWLNPETW
jgi:hypothetical protein